LLRPDDLFLSVPFYQLQETAVAQDLNTAPFGPFGIATQQKDCAICRRTQLYCGPPVRITQPKHDRFWIESTIRLSAGWCDDDLGATVSLIVHNFELMSP